MAVDDQHPIASQVAKLQAQRQQSSIPVSEELLAEQKRLDAASVPAGLLPVGSPFPDGNLITADNKPTSIKQAAGGAPAVIVFYRGSWCPYCNIALNTYRNLLWPKLKELGVQLIAISPQKPDGSMTMQQKHDLDFAVLSDPGNQIATSLGILTSPSPEGLAIQKKFGIDLTALNADGTAGLPMPTVALIDQDRVLLWLDVHPDHTIRTEPEAILAALETLTK